MSVIVLVGGSFLGGWAWEKVTPSLQAAGHEVYPLTLTGAGDRAHLASTSTTLNLNADDIVHAIEYADLREVILVGHSYGGAPATIAASRIPDRIARIVYIAGALPAPGKTLFEQSGAEVEGAIMQSVDADGDGWLIPVMSDFILDAVFGDHGLTTEDRAYLRARGTGQPVSIYRDPAPADLSAVEKLPRAYVLCAGDPGDPAIKPGAPGFDVETLDSGHWPMITRPEALAEVISRWAERGVGTLSR
jgi:pimeloyl-ACP methyl ester carboxylesterase